jgi:hypothetical protein
MTFLISGNQIYIKYAHAAKTSTTATYFSFSSVSTAVLKHALTITQNKLFT